MSANDRNERPTRARGMRRWFVTGVVVAALAVAMFIAAIWTESGKLGGTGGIIAVVGLIIMMVTVDALDF